MSSTTDIIAAPAAAAAPSSASPAPQLEPIIPGCTAHKYYRVPAGLKALRRKQKVGIIFGYVGECYCGLQWNHLPEYPTVEEALMKALFETDMISEINFSNVKVQQLLNFERASRTDKGVHALRNVISVAVMLPYDPAYAERQQAAMAAAKAEEGEEANASAPADDKEDETQLQSAFSCDFAKELLNRALPRDLHVYAVVPVTRSFNAYLNCGGRRYEYYLPTFALMSHSEYANDYFPSSLAPSQPTLKEVGFVAGKFGKCGAAQRPRAAPLTEEEEEAQRRKKQHSARKSKGHFPKRKRAKAAAAAAAAAAASDATNAPIVAVTAEEKSGSAVATDVHVAAAAEVGTEHDNATPHAAAPPIETAEHENDDDDNNSDGAESDADSDVEVQATLARAEHDDLDENYATHFHDGLFETMILFRTIPADAMERVSRYRLAQEQLAHIRRLFHTYEGTHCFHNFTPGGRSYDASCHRFMRSVTVSDPFVVSPEDALLQHSIDTWSLNHFYSPDERVAATYEEWLAEAGMTEGLKEKEEASANAPTTTTTAAAASGDAAPSSTTPGRKVPAAVDAALRDRMRQHIRAVYKGGIEVVRIELDGQSFMLNQIRKMIGAVVCIAAAGLPDYYIPDVLLRKGIRRGIPMAPANGLFLAFLDFSGYNRRLERIQSNGNNGTGKGSLDVEANVDPVEVEAQRQRIIAVVLRNEMAEDIMGKWMRSLRHVVRLAWKHEIP